jgi:L-seryl-tRNA(Ser) seleniumtransferase
MPTARLASGAVTLRGPDAALGADAIDAGLRRAPVPVIGRIEDGRLWLDARTIAPDEVTAVVAAVRGLGSGPL